MRFKRDYTEEQRIEKKRQRSLLVLGGIGLLAVTFSSCVIDDKELTQLRETNKQLSEGIKQILKNKRRKGLRWKSH